MGEWDEGQHGSKGGENDGARPLHGGFDDGPIGSLAFFLIGGYLADQDEGITANHEVHCADVFTDLCDRQAVEALLVISQGR